MNGMMKPGSASLKAVQEVCIGLALAIPAPPHESAFLWMTTRPYYDTKSELSIYLEQKYFSI